VGGERNSWVRPSACSISTRTGKVRIAGRSIVSRSSGRRSRSEEAGGAATFEGASARAGAGMKDDGRRASPPAAIQVASGSLERSTLLRPRRGARSGATAASTRAAAGVSAAFAGGAASGIAAATMASAAFALFDFLPVCGVADFFESVEGFDAVTGVGGAAVTAGFSFFVAFFFGGSGLVGAAAAFFTAAFFRGGGGAAAAFFAGVFARGWLGFFAAVVFEAAFFAGLALGAAGAVLAGWRRFGGAAGFRLAVAFRSGATAGFFFAAGRAAAAFLAGLLFAAAVLAAERAGFFTVRDCGFAALTGGLAARDAFFAALAPLPALPAGFAAAFRDAGFGVAAAGLLLLLAALFPLRLAGVAAERLLFFAGFLVAVLFVVFPFAAALPAAAGLLTLAARFAGVLLLVDLDGAVAPLRVLLPLDRFAFTAGMNPPRLRELAVGAIVAAS
jgi:hypothetical protein